jgi:hypothetical protein
MKRDINDLNFVDIRISKLAEVFKSCQILINPLWLEVVLSFAVILKVGQRKWLCTAVNHVFSKIDNLITEILEFTDGIKTLSRVIGSSKHKAAFICFNSVSEPISYKKWESIDVARVSRPELRRGGRSFKLDTVWLRDGNPRSALTNERFLHHHWESGDTFNLEIWLIICVHGPWSSRYFYRIVDFFQHTIASTGVSWRAEGTSTDRWVCGDIGVCRIWIEVETVLWKAQFNTWIWRWRLGASQ